nr:exosome complex component RRP46 isoform X1 [Megalopta genalis]XP_033338333.1 exosome complex component RRP46 isoform X1 [Megalopta genalis]
MTEEANSNEFMLRPMSCELNQLSMPDGSAMLMQGDTAVIAGIYGPAESKAQKMLYDKASVEVSYAPIKGAAKVDDRVTEMYIKETCEAAIITTFHPATSICVNVQELDDSGGLLSCILNATCLALINAGIPMKFTIGAVSCMIEEGTANIILDPDNNQLQNARVQFTFGFDSMNKDVVCCHTEGRFTQSEFFEAMDKCKQASQYVFDFYRNIVKKYAKAI